MIIRGVAWRGVRDLKGRKLAVTRGTTNAQALKTLDQKFNLGITLVENRLDLTSSQLRIEDRGVPARRVAWGPRIGIRVGIERPWRCWVPEVPSVSGTRP